MESNDKNKDLALFEAAMQKVYGPYNASASVAEHTKWEPGNAGGHRGRYLWTDAFGVLNFITLSREASSSSYSSDTTSSSSTSSPTLSASTGYLRLARRLAETVHEVLGREREREPEPPAFDMDSYTRIEFRERARLPGATNAAPLNGGLRIGKKDGAGPDGDGMYHHYLTLWMYALDCLARATGEVKWNSLAVQLAEAIHPRFVRLRHRTRRTTGSGVGADNENRGNEDEDVVCESMVWKISTDMRRVLVASKGHLDDVTGYVVFRLLRDTARKFREKKKSSSGAKVAASEPEDDVLTEEIEQYERIMAHSDLSLSGDPLDLGMGLWIAHFDCSASWSREMSSQALEIARERFLAHAQKPLTAASRLHRLAFREFGACLGIKCYGADLEQLMDGVATVLDIWEKKMIGNEGGDGSDLDLRPISLVMYAAALIPGGKFPLYLLFMPHG